MLQACSPAYTKIIYDSGIAAPYEGRLFRQAARQQVKSRWTIVELEHLDVFQPLGVRVAGRQWIGHNKKLSKIVVMGGRYLIAAL